MSGLDFPQYRKLANEKSHYEIRDDRHFVEKQLIGKQVFIIEIEAKQYPEILRIQDMLHCVEGFLLSTKEVFESIGTENAAPDQA
ncbi:MAG: hypothetical protein RLZZ585_1723 [Bacteroidota bacterium]|jgi:hypothetical protein